MPIASPAITVRMISDYCRRRLSKALAPREVEAIREYLLRLIAEVSPPPKRGDQLDWPEIAEASGVSAASIGSAKRHLTPIFDALTRSLEKQKGTRRQPAPALTPLRDTPKAARKTEHTIQQTHETDNVSSPPPHRKRRAYRRKPVVEFPAALAAEWEDPPGFAEALRLHTERHGDTARHLFRAVIGDDQTLNHRTLMKWVRGELIPGSVQSFEILARIEHRYRLPAGYFKSKLPHPSRAPRGHVLDGISSAERRRLAWHLPDDFPDRQVEQQEEILAWVRRVIITGATDYRVFQAAAMKQRYAVRFWSFLGGPARARLSIDEDVIEDELDIELRSAVVDAPLALEQEMTQLLRFKTSTLTAFGFQRIGVWNGETASQKVEHLGLMFGALAASPKSVVRGFGVDLDSVCFAMLVFPAVWDWYLQWRERRRGFYTKWEIDMLSIVLALVRKDTGWIRQTPSLAERLRPVPGLVSEEDIARARTDWHTACDQMHTHGRTRIKEIQRVARIHRDPFEPILPVLEADSPVGEYRKITEEILRLMPDERRYPRAAAEAARAFLLLRLGLHLGLRQRNLRELRVCLPGRTPISERHLEDMKCGELRWSAKEQGWEVLIPAVAFKNASSSFFGSKPFRLVLPDLGGLYEVIEAYLDRHRARLLGPAADPGTFFVKSVKRTSANAAYNQNTFYEAWKLVIQRYGIHNPYTGRGVIEGLLPHGPHNVRDVLATHILKQTGSYEQASYAIQDTPDMVAKHYGRFLPQDKSAIAAQILNRVWDAA